MGHSYQSAVKTRVQGTGCPYCAGKRVAVGETDLASQVPELVEQWDAEKNGDLSPQAVSPNSNRAVWWLCPLGHSYRAVVAHRTREGSGCPYCAGKKVLPGFNDLETLHPQVAREWHPTRNGALTPQQITPGSNRRVWWQCDRGHEWQAVVFSRTDWRRCGCPICARGVRKQPTAP